MIKHCYIRGMCLEKNTAFSHHLLISVKLGIKPGSDDKSLDDSNRNDRMQTSDTN